MRIGVAHHLTALIFYNITHCYGKQVAVFAVAVAAGDIMKYQSFVYGSFVWGIHVRYNNNIYGPTQTCTFVNKKWTSCILWKYWNVCVIVTSELTFDSG